MENSENYRIKETYQLSAEQLEAQKAHRKRLAKKKAKRKKYRCDVCDSFTFEARSLLRHYWNKHDLNRKMTLTDRKGKPYQISVPCKIWVCLLCWKKTKQKSSIFIHIKGVHEMVDEPIVWDKHYTIEERLPKLKRQNRSMEEIADDFLCPPPPAPAALSGGKRTIRF